MPRFAGTLVLSDDLTEAIRARRVLEGDEGLLATAIARGKKLGSQHQTVQPDATFIGSGNTKPTEPSSDNSAEEFDFLAPAQQPDEIGRLGDYRVLQVLGIGGMGVVFRAEDTRLKVRWH